MKKVKYNPTTVVSPPKIIPPNQGGTFTGEIRSKPWLEKNPYAAKSFHVEIHHRSCFYCRDTSHDCKNGPTCARFFPDLSEDLNYKQVTIAHTSSSISSHLEKGKTAQLLSMYNYRGENKPQFIIMYDL